MCAYSELSSQKEDRSAGGSRISRRRFFELAGLTAAALSTAGLHSVAGGIAYAYADESDELSFVVDVLSRKSVGFVVNDVSKGTRLVDDQGNIATAEILTGAKVVLRTYYAKATLASVEGVTDAEGKVVFDDISAMAKEVSDDSLPSYHFWGSLEVTKEGYRTFKTGHILVQGAHFFVAATQPTTPTTSYLRCCTFEGFDIQYFSSTVPTVKTITEQQTVLCEVVAPSAKKVEVELTNDGWWTGIKKSAQVSEGIAVIKIPYAYSRDSKITGRKTYLTMYLDGKKAYKVTTKLAFRKAQVDEPKDGKVGIVPGEDKASKPLSEDVTTIVEGPLKLKLPSKIPIIGDAEFDPGIGSLPVSFRFDPFGLSYFGINVTDPYEEFNGEEVKDAWKRQNLETMKQHRENMEKAFWGAIQRFDQCKRHKQEKNAFIGTSPKFSSFETGLSFSLLATGEYDWKADDGSWDFGPQLTVAYYLAYSLTKQFMVGPVPMFLGFGITFDLSFIMRFLARMKKLDFSTLTWSPKSSEPFIITFALGISVTAGVGIKGIVSVSVTGRGALDCAVTVHTKKDKARPHVVLCLSAAVVVVGQFLFYKVTVIPYNRRWDDPPFFDNWNHREGDAANLPTNPDGSLGELPFSMLGGVSAYEMSDRDMAEAEWKIVDEATIGKTAEFSGTVPVEDPTTEDPLGEGAAGEDIRRAGYSTYSYDDEDAWTGADVSAFAIEGASELGVKPTVDTKIFNEVLSDPRTKIIDFANMTFMFRLVSVRIKTSDNREVYRTRVCVSRFDDTKGTWDKPSVLDFGLRPVSASDNPTLAFDATNDLQGISVTDEGLTLSAPDAGSGAGITSSTKREDLFDVDFDVHSSSRGLLLFVVSSARPDGDQTSIGAAGDATCASLALYSVWSDANNVYFYDYRMSASFYGKKINEKQPFVMNPSLATRDGYSDGVGLLELRIADDNLPGVFSSTRYFARISFEISGFDTFSNFKYQLLKREGQGGDSWTEVSLPRRAFDYRYLFLCGQYIDATQKRHAAFYFPGKTKDIEIPHAIEVCWLDYISALYVKEIEGKKSLVLITRDSDVERIVSLDGFNYDSFRASADGRHLFWTQVEEGEGFPEHDGEGSLVAGSARPMVKKFTIMASKRYGTGENMVFTAPFALAELGHRPDYLTDAKGKNDALDFCYMNFTSPDISAADLYYTRIPWVQSVKLIGCACDDPFAGAGEKTPLSFRVVNCGSVCVDGMKVSIYDNPNKTGSPVDTVDVSFTKSTIQNTLNMFNPNSPRANNDGYVFEAEDSDLETLADSFNINGVLLPGQDRVYTGYMNVPAEWKSGKRELYAFIESSTVTLSGTPSGSDFIEELPTAEGAVLSWYNADEALAFSYDSVPLVIPTAASQYEYYGNNDNLPPTSDNSSLGLPLALGAAAAVAGLTAYSKRRADNARAQEEEDGAEL